MNTNQQNATQEKKHTKTSKTQTQTKEIVLSHTINIFDDDAMHLLFFLNNISLSFTRCLEYYGEDDLRTSQSHCFKKTYMPNLGQLLHQVIVNLKLHQHFHQNLFNKQ